MPKTLDLKDPLGAQHKREVVPPLQPQRNPQTEVIVPPDVSALEWVVSPQEEEAALQRAGEMREQERVMAMPQPPRFEEIEARPWFSELDEAKKMQVVDQWAADVYDYTARHDGFTPDVADGLHKTFAHYRERHSPGLWSKFLTAAKDSALGMAGMVLAPVVDPVYEQEQRKELDKLEQAVDFYRQRKQGSRYTQMVGASVDQYLAGARAAPESTAVNDTLKWLGVGTSERTLNPLNDAAWLLGLKQSEARTALDKSWDIAGERLRRGVGDDDLMELLEGVSQTLAPQVNGDDAGAYKARRMREPVNLALAERYRKTGNPAYLDELKANMTLPEATLRSQERVEELTEGLGDTYKTMLEGGTDAGEMAAMLVEVPLTAGAAKVARRGMTGTMANFLRKDSVKLAGAVGGSALTEAATEAAQTLAENPNEGLEGIGEAAGMGAALGTVLPVTGAAAGVTPAVVRSVVQGLKKGPTKAREGLQNLGELLDQAVGKKGYEEKKAEGLPIELGSGADAASGERVSNVSESAGGDATKAEQSAEVDGETGDQPALEEDILSLLPDRARREALDVLRAGTTNRKVINEQKVSEQQARLAEQAREAQEQARETAEVRNEQRVQEVQDQRAKEIDFLKGRSDERLMEMVLDQSNPLAADVLAERYPGQPEQVRGLAQRVEQERREQEEIERLTKEAQEEALAEAQEEAMQWPELLEALKRNPLPTPKESRILKGELRQLGEASKNARMRFFRKGAKSLEQVREAMAEEGFYFETPAEMVQAIEERVAGGRPVYGMPNNAEVADVAWSKGKKAKAVKMQAYLAGVLPRIRRGELLNVNIPVANVEGVYKDMGLDDSVQIMVGTGVLRKAQDKHLMDDATLSGLHEGLASPTFILKNPSETGVADALVVLGDMEFQGKPVVAAIKWSNLNKRLLVHDIKSIHPKGYFKQNFPKWVNDGKLLYVDTKKAPRWVREFAPRQLRGMMTLSGAYRNILTESGVVKLHELELSKKKGREKSGGVVELQAEADALVDGWAGAPSVEVVADMDSVPDEYQGAVAAASLSGDKLEAFYDRRQDRVIVLADAVSDVQQLRRKVLHEVVGHKGLPGVFQGKRRRAYERSMAGIYRALYQEQFSAEWQALHGYSSLPELAEWYGFDLTTAEGKARLVEEHLARVAEENPRATLVQRWVAAVRALLREVMPDLAWTDGDILALLDQARLSIERAGRGDIAFSKKLLGGEQSISSDERAFARQLEDVDAAEVAYDALPDAAGGRVLNVDTARELYEPYKKDRRRYSVVTHAPASGLIKKLWKRKLSRLKPGDNVLLLGGGGGSGKSSVVMRVMPEALEQADLVLDGTLSDSQKLQEMLRELAQRQIDYKIVYVHRPVELAYQGMVERSKKEGRIVPKDVLARAHYRAQKNILFQLDAGVENIVVLDNSGAPHEGGFVAKPVDFLSNSGKLLMSERDALERIEAYEHTTIRREPLHPGSYGATAQEGGRREKPSNKQGRLGIQDSDGDGGGPAETRGGNAGGARSGGARSGGAKQLDTTPLEQQDKPSGEESTGEGLSMSKRKDSVRADELGRKIRQLEGLLAHHQAKLATLQASAKELGAARKIKEQRRAIKEVQQERAELVAELGDLQAASADDAFWERQEKLPRQRERVEPGYYERTKAAVEELAAELEYEKNSPDPSPRFVETLSEMVERARARLKKMGFPKWEDIHEINEELAHVVEEFPSEVEVPPHLQAIADDMEGAPRPADRRPGQLGGPMLSEEVVREQVRMVEGASHEGQSALEWLGEMVQKSLRGFLQVPELAPMKVKDRALFVQGYSQLRRATQYVAGKAHEKIGRVLEPLKDLDDGQRREAYELFRKAILWNDLWFRSQIETGQVAPDGTPEKVTLPLRMHPDTVAARREELRVEVNKSPYAARVKEAMRRHYQLTEATRLELEERGLPIAEDLRNPFYFPHKVLDFWSGQIEQVAIDVKGDFRGYLLQPKGSTHLVESDYLKAMYSHVVEVMAHNRREDIVEEYWLKPYDIMDEARQRWTEWKKGNPDSEVQTFTEFVEEYYPDHAEMAYDPRLPLKWGLVLDPTVLGEEFADAAKDGKWARDLREQGIKVDSSMLQQALVAGQKRKMLLPRPVKDALMGILKREQERVAPGVMGKALSMWKWMILNFPTNAIRYNYGNFVSDAEKVFSADPYMVTYLPEAYRQVRTFLADGVVPNEDFSEAIKRGVLESPTAAEIGRIGELPAFEEFDWDGNLLDTARDVAQAVRGNPLQAVDRLDKATGAARRKARASRLNFFAWGENFATTREATFRMAKYLADLDRLRKGQALYYGGARKAEVDALPNDFDKAARISNETFVDYSMISPNGEWMRRNLIPFYSWIEGNFRYHANIVVNIAEQLASPDERGAGLVTAGGLVGKAASKLIIHRGVAGFVVRLALPYIAVALWNNTGERKELEEMLSEHDKRKFHIILGRDETGQTMLMYAPTALLDVAKWFGLQNSLELVRGYYTGQLTFQQAVTEYMEQWGRDLVNEVSGSMRPEIKTVVGAVMGRDMFPDVFEARAINSYDLRRFILSNMVDRNLADWFERWVNDDYMGRPFYEQLAQIVFQVRRRDPEQWAYYHMRDKVEAFLSEKGEVGSFGSYENNLTQVKRNFYRAVYKGDVPNAVKFYTKLVEGGYTYDQMMGSLRSRDPLSRLSKTSRSRHGNIRKEFVDSLSDFDRKQLHYAYRYLARLSDPKTDKTMAAKLFPKSKLPREARAAYAQSGGNPDYLRKLLLRRDLQKKSEPALDAAARRLMLKSLK